MELDQLAKLRCLVGQMINLIFDRGAKNFNEQVKVRKRTITNTATHICDMIKGNESDVANIDFEL